MAFEYKMPKFGLTMDEGTITQWFKKVGDSVTEDDDLIEIETDKITNIEKAPASGVILHIAYQEGDTAACQEVLCVIGEAGEKYEGGASAAAPVAAPVVAETTVAAAPTMQSTATVGGPVIASPAAKKLAKEKGVDLSTVTPTGPNGRIIERDVKNVKITPLALHMAMEHGMTAADLEAMEVEGRIMSSDIKAAVTSTPAPAPLKEGGKKLSGMRKVISERMTKSHTTYPAVTVDMEVDMTEAKALKAKYASVDKKLSYTEIIVKACAVALTEFKEVNSSLVDGYVYENENVNIGIAVSLDNGLIVPVVKDADKKGIATIGDEVKKLAKDARENSLSPDAMSGGTFTVSNLGGYPVTHFTPIINYPEAAILGVCALKDKPVVIDGVIAVRPMMNLCLSFDHRLIDGVLSAKFLARVVDLIEKPFLL